MDNMSNSVNPDINIKSIVDWYVALVLTSNVDGHYLEPISSPAYTYQNVLVDNESQDLYN